MIAAGPHARGVVVPVLAQLGSRRDGIIGERSGAVRIAVTAPPEKGKANEAIQSVLALALGCKASQVTLLSGTTSRRKRFLIEGMTADDLARRLAPLIGEPQSKHSQS
jgi:uncharacterized protein